MVLPKAARLHGGAPEGGASARVGSGGAPEGGASARAGSGGAPEGESAASQKQQPKKKDRAPTHGGYKWFANLQQNSRARAEKRVKEVDADQKKKELDKHEANKKKELDNLEEAEKKKKRRRRRNGAAVQQATKTARENNRTSNRRPKKPRRTARTMSDTRTQWRSMTAMLLFFCGCHQRKAIANANVSEKKFSTN